MFKSSKNPPKILLVPRFRALYKMFGNAVSPPLVAALSDVVLEPLGLGGRGSSAALRLALGAVAPLRRQQLRQGLHGSWRKKKTPEKWPFQEKWFHLMWKIMENPY